MTLHFKSRPIEYSRVESTSGREYITQVKKCNGKYFLTLYKGDKQTTETRLDTTPVQGYKNRTDTVQK